MQIKNNLLFNDDGSQVNFVATPNKGSRYKPQYLVIHYTAATTAQSAINWFQNPNAQASAHLLIDRDGTITQFAPFNIITWHAGKSQWKGLNNLNQFSIGIELVNGGRLVKTGENWVCPVDKRKVPGNEVILATHKNESREAAWHDYSAEQLEATIQVSALLVRTYALLDVVGHDDISPLRKSDPGPAFPMGSLKSKAMGRQDETQDEFVTSALVNIRSGAGTNFSPLTQPLAQGTHVLVLKTEGTWSFVEVLDTAHGVMDLEGWVSTKFLVKP